MTTLRFDPSTGLVPAVVQDARSGRVLMLGYMNAEALARTQETGRVTFFSRERRQLWTKGETSGHSLALVELRADCDADAVLVRVSAGGPTCHTGHISCFGDPAVFALGEVLGELYDVIEDRKARLPADSYTADLLRGGIPGVARKVAEEAVELCLEAVTGGPRTAEEAADLLYHTLVLLSALGRTPEDVARVLAARRDQAA